jgi:diguanylate cyclase (GGDEF)-like protein/PAS domain S-box-containing protein
MDVVRITARSVNGSAIPPEVYFSLVDSLYQEGRTLLLGYIMVVGSIVLTFYKTNEPLFLACALLFSLIAGGRALDMQAYTRARDRIKSAGDASRWEYRYGVGAASALATLGAWCFLAFAKTSDPFTQLVSFSITIAYVIGISGRNFGSSRLVLIQIASVAGPMIAALLIYGNVYYQAAVPMFGVFFAGLALISSRLRRNLLAAVMASREISQLVERFDTALNNMSHGLCMVDADRRVVVANRKLKEQMGLSEDVDLKGLSLIEMIDRSVDIGTLSRDNGNQFARNLADPLASGADHKFSIELLSGRTFEFTVEPMENRGIVMLVEDITERKHAVAKIDQMARFDMLTGLPNRAVLEDSLAKALKKIEGGGSFAVHFIDLDQFKQINDTLGHSRGDALLKIAARRLCNSVRGSDLVARFGGDEFIVLQWPVADEEEISILAERILRLVGAPYDVDGNKVEVSASIGIAVAPTDGDNVDQILRNADMALYQAKAESRDTWRFFKPEMEAYARARRGMEFDLRDALANNAFEIYYQPVVELRTNRIVCCEALLRWPHPERGMISPAEFIPIAEEMGIITEIDQWVLRKACEECQRWPNGIRVAVNLSPLQFARTDVAQVVRTAVAEVGLLPSRLEIEITETILLQDTEGSYNALRELRQLGVNVSLDDFGTKYSSLSYLHNFPLDKIKIDQSFVHDLTDGSRRMTLLRGIARLSAELGLRVTIEGVETEEQLALISTEPNIDEVQGYLFGVPLPSSAIRSLLRAGTPLHVGKVA